MKEQKGVTGRGRVGRLGAAADEGKPPWRPEPGRCYGPGFLRTTKKRVTLNLDADVLAWFKKQGRGWQTRINRELWKLMMEERKRSVWPLYV